MCDEYNYKKLLVIRNKFLCCVPVQEIGLKNLQNNLTWDEQQFLLNQTVNNKLIKNYPIKQSYQKLFLKTLITLLESNSTEIHDSLYQTYCSILNINDTNKYNFKHYCLKNEILTLKENKNFISEGTTGLCTWQASLALSEFCLSNSNLLKNKCILELGSGVGLVGITVALNCQSTSIYLSDCHPKVLKILSENVLLNCTNRETIEPESSVKTVTETIRARVDSVGNETIRERADFDGLSVNKTATCDFNNETIESDLKSSDAELSDGNNSLLVESIKSFSKADLNLSELNDYKNCDGGLTVISKTIKNNTEVYVLDLAWESINKNQCSSLLRPDFVLAADVVYDNSVFEPLCNVVNFFLDLNQNCQVVFACTERNSDTLNEFLSLLETNKLIIEEIPAPKSKQRHNMSERRGTKALETWCRRMTDGYPGVKVENMTTSWRDGLAFCAIIHHFRPDLIEFSKLNKDNVYHNNSLAFRLAERHLGIPALLDAEDMVEYEVPDRLSILTYLSQFYQVLAIPQGSASRIVAKRPAVATDRGIVTPTSSSPPTKMAVRPAGSTGGALGRREPCAICALPVFLAERLNVGAKLYHRTCFRCARCKNQLSLANCYETEDGQYCCETCPDEEETSAKVAKFDSCASHTFDSLDSSNTATSHTFETPYTFDNSTKKLNDDSTFNDKLSKFGSSSDKLPKFGSSFTNRLSNFDSSAPKFNSSISNKSFDNKIDSFDLKRQRLDQVRNRSLSDEEKTKGLQQFEDDAYSASFETALEEKLHEDDSLLSKARNTFLTSHLLNEDHSAIDSAAVKTVIDQLQTAATADTKAITDNSTAQINNQPEHLTKSTYIQESTTFTTVPSSAKTIKSIIQLSNKIEDTPPPLPSSKPPDPVSLTTKPLSSVSPSEPCVNKPSNTNPQIQTISDETTNLRIKNATKDDTTNRSSLVKSRMLMFEEQTSDSPASLGHKTSIVSKYFNNSNNKKADNNVPLNIFENNSNISNNLNISTKLTENDSNLEDSSPKLSNSFKNDQKINKVILSEGESGIMLPFASGTSEINHTGISPVLSKGDTGILLPLPSGTLQNVNTESAIGSVLSVGESGIMLPLNVGSSKMADKENGAAIIAIGDSGVLIPLIQESNDHKIGSDLYRVETAGVLPENLGTNENEFKNMHENEIISLNTEITESVEANEAEIILQTTEDTIQTSVIREPEVYSKPVFNIQNSSEVQIEDSTQKSITFEPETEDELSSKPEQNELLSKPELDDKTIAPEVESPSSIAELENTSETNIEIKPIPLRRSLLDKTSKILNNSTNLQQTDELSSINESHSNNFVTPQLDDSDKTNKLNDSDMKHKILRSDLNNSDSLDFSLEGNSSPKIHPRIKYLNKSLLDNLSDQTVVSIDSSLLDSTKSDLYPDDLNPFGDDEDEITETKSLGVQKLIKPSMEDLRFLSPTPNPRRKKSEHRKSNNPFDSEDDEVLLAKPPLPKKPDAAKKVVEAPKINLNPFWSDGEEHSEEDIAKPVPLPRTKPLGTPEPKPRRSELSNNSDRYNSNSSLSSLNSSFGGPSRKKKPAPLPPSNLSVSPQSSKQTSPCSSTQQSPRLTPKFRKNRKAPLPPTFSTPFVQNQVCHTTTNLSPITGQPDLVTTPITGPLNSDLEQLGETQYFTPIGSVTGDFESEKINKDEKNRNRQSQAIPSPVSDSDDLSTSPSIDKSMHGKWKRKKGPAPARPVPQRRRIKPLPLTELRRELDIIEMQQQGLEKQGVKLEQLIREKCEGPDATEDTVLSIEVEDMVLELFELVNEKNELFRKQAELMYLRRQQRLEEEYADLEYQIRCLMDRPERNKTDTDKAREEELINRLVEVVERRNEIVECLEMDRVREAEEDHSINSRLNSLASKRDEENSLSTLDSPVKLSKKEKKKMKKDKKMKEKGKTLDVDKDIDESETSLTSLDKKKKKKKWFLH